MDTKGRDLYRGDNPTVGDILKVAVVILVAFVAAVVVDYPRIVNFLLTMGP